jgi:dTDP-4-amino-4,6-dideoxygalactose transaminase
MQVAGIGAGDEVLVPAMTFVASANAVEHAGATPVLVDSVPGTGLIDFDSAEAAITPRTRAIMPVHLAGRPVDMERLTTFAERHGAIVIEDAARAIGAEWHGRRIGSFGNLARRPNSGGQASPAVSALCHQRSPRTFEDSTPASNR